MIEKFNQLKKGVKKMAGRAVVFGSIATTLAGAGCDDKPDLSSDQKFLKEASKVLEQRQQEHEQSYTVLLKSYHQKVEEGKLPLQGMLVVTPEARARARELARIDRHPVGDKTLEVLEVRGFVPVKIKVGGQELFSYAFNSDELKMIKGVEQALGIKKIENNTNQIQNSTNSINNNKTSKKTFISGGDDF
jgi:hypothetical protein